MYWSVIDPTQEGGQFADLGHHYETVIFYHDEKQKEEAEESKEKLDKSGLYDRPIVTKIRKAETFYIAEDYHQYYYKKNPDHYNRYYKGSGRAKYINKIWAKKNLTPMQYEVTQNSATEPPFNNEYYNNFEKTSEVFVQNPLNSRYPELIYKTGDLGKRNERGELIFVSRKDYQIKHMGHRIELGEIEVNVNMIEEISTSCAVYDKEKGKIVLYYIGELEPDKLVRILKDKLPRYMIPNKTEKLEQMPLTANGKIDRVFLMKKAQER